jgi:hypothetical protein
MSRFTLAFSCLFRLLAGKSLRPEAAAYLPEPVTPTLPPASPATAASPATSSRSEAAPGRVPGAAPGSGGIGGAEPRQRRAPHGPPGQIDGALALLGLLQREGRLIDFLQEAIDAYDDAQIGAAVRDIHRGCKKALTEHVALEPVMPGSEDERVTVPAGFDPGDVRLIGKVSGEPPFRGVLRHHGWRVTKVELPLLTDGVDRRVVAPAEVEVA